MKFSKGHYFDVDKRNKIPDIQPIFSQFEKKNCLNFFNNHIVNIIQYPSHFSEYYIN